jgi:hypothetical protein
MLVGLLPEGALAPRESTITRGLLILKEPLDKILAGTKTWEIRGRAPLDAVPSR